MRALAKRLLRSEAATAAVEFAMVAPAFMALIVAGVFAAQLMYSASSLRYAAEAGARCASVNTTICTDNTSTQTYAAGKYLGPASPAPSFVAASAACGHSVTGTTTFAFNTGWKTISVPLSASACFP